MHMKGIMPFVIVARIYAEPEAGEVRAETI